MINKDNSIKEAGVKTGVWLLALLVITLCVSPALGQGSGNTPGDQEMPDYTSCQNSPKHCPHPCPDETKAECKYTNNSFSPSGVLLSRGESYTIIDYDSPDASPAESSCNSCVASRDIPPETQLMRLRLRRIWRSSLWHHGSFGSHMFTSYDYVVRSSQSDGLIQFTDPNTGDEELFLESAGGVFVPFRINYHTKIVEKTATHITFVKLDGLKLRFAWTGYFEGGVYARARLEYVADRNNNRITFSYTHPAADTTRDAFMWNSATDPYGRTFQFRYVNWLGGNFISQVILPDQRAVNFSYDDSLNYFFAHRVDYGDGIVTTWTYDDATQTHTRNEALLDAKHYNQQIRQSLFAPGRTRSIKRADGTLLYSRQDVDDGERFISKKYVGGETFEIVNSSSKMLISHRQQKVDGSWEESTGYDADDNRPVKEVAQPDGRRWVG